MRRNLQPEIMDQPGLAAREHLSALTGLERVNWLSGSARILWPQILALARRSGGRTLRVLDVASGGGDVPLALWHLARRHGVSLDIHGIDISPVAVQHAKEAAARWSAPVTFGMANVLHDSLPEGYDVVMSSLFLHHLPEADAVSLLRKMRNATRGLVLVNDLRRNWSGYWLALLVSHLVTRSHLVHVDGPRSAAGAWTMKELAELCDKAGMPSARIERRWPCRMLLHWCVD
jgi:2-polyprenyl-3-methyl-5-hydroxy-6-metoxy-1,4-benzoquinol methylase